MVRMRHQILKLRVLFSIYNRIQLDLNGQLQQAIHLYNTHGHFALRIYKNIVFSQCNGFGAINLRNPDKMIRSALALYPWCNISTQNSCTSCKGWLRQRTGALTAVFTI